MEKEHQWVILELVLLLDPPDDVVNRRQFLHFLRREVHCMRWMSRALRRGGGGTEGRGDKLTFLCSWFGQWRPIRAGSVVPLLLLLRHTTIISKGGGGLWPGLVGWSTLWLHNVKIGTEFQFVQKSVEIRKRTPSGRFVASAVGGGSSFWWWRSRRSLILGMTSLLLALV